MAGILRTSTSARLRRSPSGSRSRSRSTAREREPDSSDAWRMIRRAHGDHRADALPSYSARSIVLACLQRLGCPRLAQARVRRLPTSAFKVRGGVYLRVAAFDVDELAERGLVTSVHRQSRSVDCVSVRPRSVQTSATIFMPTDANPGQDRGHRAALAASVELVGERFDECFAAAAEEFAARAWGPLRRAGRSEPHADRGCRLPLRSRCWRHQQPETEVVLAPTGGGRHCASSGWVTCS